MQSVSSMLHNKMQKRKTNSIGVRVVQPKWRVFYGGAHDYARLQI